MSSSKKGYDAIFREAIQFYVEILNYSGTKNFVSDDNKDQNIIDLIYEYQNKYCIPNRNDYLFRSQDRHESLILSKNPKASMKDIVTDLVVSEIIKFLTNEVHYESLTNFNFMISHYDSVVIPLTIQIINNNINITNGEVSGYKTNFTEKVLPKFSFLEKLKKYFVFDKMKDSIVVNINNYITEKRNLPGSEIEVIQLTKICNFLRLQKGIDYDYIYEKLFEYSILYYRDNAEMDIYDFMRELDFISVKEKIISEKINYIKYGYDNGENKFYKDFVTTLAKNRKEDYVNIFVNIFKNNQKYLYMWYSQFNTFSSIKEIEKIIQEYLKSEIDLEIDSKMKEFGKKFIRKNENDDHDDTRKNENDAQNDKKVKKVIKISKKDVTKNIYDIMEFVLFEYKKLTDINNKYFSKDKDFANIIDIFFRYIINKKEVTPYSKDEKNKYLDTKIFEVLNYYITEPEEEKYDLIYTFIREFIEFIHEIISSYEFYIQSLKNRMLNSRFDDSEERESKIGALIGKRYGYGNIKEIINTYKTSNEIFTNYKKINDASNINSIKIISNLIAPSKKEYVLDKEISTAFTNFNNYYKETHPGKKLDILHEYGTCDLIIDNENAPRGKYIFELTPVETSIVLLFNHRRDDNYIGLNLDEITRLLKANVLEQLSYLVLNEILILENGMYMLNNNFKAKTKTSKVKLIRNKNLTTGEVEKAVEKTLEEKKYLLQTTIVRNMKRNKEMEHDELFRACSEDLLKYFTVDQKLFKNEIEKLMEKEYMERHPEIKKRYLYMS